MHVVAAFALLPLSIPWLWRGAGWVGLLFSLIWYERRLAEAAGGELHFAPDGIWLRLGAERRKVQQQGAARVTPWLVVLNLRAQEDGARHSLVLLPDSMAPADFRRLRVLLRWDQPG